MTEDPAQALYLALMAQDLHSIGPDGQPYAVHTIAATLREAGQGLTWSKEKPTTVGWYWWRNKEIVFGPAVVEIYSMYQELRVTADGKSTSHALTDYTASSIEWAGPLELPEER